MPDATGSDAIAHAAKDSTGNWRPPHDLDEHLRAVGALAAHFANRCGAEWAHLAGRWHDLGKYRPRFQRYIRQASGFEADAHIKGEAGKAPHSTAGGHAGHRPVWNGGSRAGCFIAGLTISFELDQDGLQSNPSALTYINEPYRPAS